MITVWRERVWAYAVALLEAPSPNEAVRTHVQVEANAHRRADAILLGKWTAVLGELL
jgi:hypothetical protein